MCAPPRRNRRFPAGSPPKTSPATATASTATSAPPPSTASTNSPPSATRSSVVPGCPPHPRPPDIHHEDRYTPISPASIRRGDLNVYPCVGNSEELLTRERSADFVETPSYALKVDAVLCCYRQDVVLGHYDSLAVA